MTGFIRRACSVVLLAASTAIAQPACAPPKLRQSNHLDIRVAFIGHVGKERITHSSLPHPPAPRLATSSSRKAAAIPLGRHATAMHKQKLWAVKATHAVLRRNYAVACKWNTSWE